MSLANAGKNKNNRGNNNERRNVPTFTEASKNPVNEEVKEVVPEEVKTVSDIVNSVIHAPKETPKRQISVYLDVDVAREFDRFGKRNGKGSKSNLINSFLKKALDVK